MNAKRRRELLEMVVEGFGGYDARRMDITYSSRHGAPGRTLFKGDWIGLGPVCPVG